MIVRLIIGSAVALLSPGVEAWAQRINTAPPITSAPPVHVAPPVSAPSVVVTPPPPPLKIDQPTVRPIPVPCTDERRRRGEC